MQHAELIGLKQDSNDAKNVVYCAYNRMADKAYIGCTVMSLPRRRSTHVCAAKNPRKGEKSHFHKALQLYGAAAFDWFVIWVGQTKKEILVKETEFIKRFGTNDREKGYNLTIGGESPIFTEETKRKISDSIKKRNLIGERNPFYGRTHTLEQKRQWSEMRLGIPNGRKGCRHSRESIENMKKVAKERCKDPKVIENMRKVQKSKRIMCLTNSTVYPSIAEAARSLGVKKGGVKGQLKGRLKTFKGMTFKYMDE